MLPNSYMPNIAWSESAAQERGKGSNLTNRKLTESEVRGELKFSTIVGPSFQTRVLVRLFETAWQHLTVAHLQTVLGKGTKVMHRKTLWKAPAKGAFEHKTDANKIRFCLFIIYSPVITGLIDENVIDFNNNVSI